MLAKKVAVIMFLWLSSICQLTTSTRKLSPSAVRSLTVERTYDRRIFYFFKRPLWTNGIIQKYKVHLSYIDKEATWYFSSGRGEFFKHELNLTKFGLNHQNTNVNLEISAINQYGEGRGVSKTFYTVGLICSIEITTEQFNPTAFKAIVDAPDYCCYAYDWTCIKPKFDVYMTFNVNEEKALYEKVPNRFIEFDHQYRHLKIDPQAFSFNKSDTSNKYRSLKLVILDREGDVIWDSTKPIKIIYLRGEYQICKDTANGLVNCRWPKGD